MNPAFIRKREEWIKQHKKELKDRTNKEIERIALNNLFSGKITADEYKEQIQFLKGVK